MPDPCPICGKDLVMVGRAHNCRPKPKLIEAMMTSLKEGIAIARGEADPESYRIHVPRLTTNTQVVNKSVDNKSNICQPESIVVNQVDNKSDGVALISVNHPKPVGKRKLPKDIDPASLVTMELPEDQVKKVKDGTTDGLRISPKRGRGRPKIEGQRPWQVEGISRQAWYKRKRVLHNG